MEVKGLKIGRGDYPPEGKPYTALLATDRDSIIDMLNKVKARQRSSGWLCISMPCGYEQTFKKETDIPYKDLSCPCGQEGRYLIRYKKE